MILIDSKGHMVSTNSEEELHNFAVKRLKMSRKWYQNHHRHPHYDLTTPRKRRQALELGTKQVTTKELIRQAWWRK